jgi:ABC-type uncharacterized transport system permease subunit
MTLAPAYLTLARLQAEIVYAYRIWAFLSLAIVLARIFLLRSVWTAVYADSSPAGGPSLTSLLTFLTLAQLQLLVLQPTLVTYLQRRIHEGLIGLDLVRPVPFLGQLVAQQAGANLAFVPFLVLAVPFALVVGSLAAPASASVLLAYGVSLILAWGISALIGLLMGLVAFWTTETHGVAVIYTFATQLLGGALVPIALFPDWLRTLAEVLPFRAVAATPVSIWTGETSGAASIAGALGLQLGWIGVLSAVAWVAWRHAQRVITVYRG